MTKKKVKVKKINKELECINTRIDGIYKSIDDIYKNIDNLEISGIEDKTALGRINDRINDVNKILRMHADQNAQRDEVIDSLVKDLVDVENTISNSWAELTVAELDETKENDPVNHPSHYTDGKYETIDFIEDYGMVTHVGTSIKYISRAGKKDEDKYIQDLSKADWYLQRYLKYLETEREPINVADFCKEKKLPLELTKVINCLAIDEYQAAHEILSEYIKKLKSNK